MRRVTLLLIVVLLFQSIACLGQSLLAQTFDERMSDWPIDLKINGTILACADTDVTNECLAYFLTAGNGEEAIVVALNLTSQDRSESVSSKMKDVAKFWYFDFNEESKTESDDQPNLNNAMRRATAVWVIADEKLSRAQRKHLDQLAGKLKAVIDRGGVVMTSGAASRTLGKFEITGGQMFGNERQATIRDGLHLVPDAVLQTQFDKNQFQRPRLLSVLGSHPRAIGIGIDSETGIIFRGRKIRAIGERQAHFFTMANDRKPLRTQSIAKPPEGRNNPYDVIVDLTAWRRDAIDRTLEAFPAEEPETPFVENGTLMIVGGGGMPDGMMEQFIELAGGEDARLVFVPCSERPEIGRRELGMTRAWLNAGVASADVVHTKDRNQANSDEEFLEPLKNATGIFFGGGRQWNFSDSYYGTEAHRLMKEVLNRGGVIAGSSAGASIQGRYLARANPVGNVDIMADGYERGGLGFISGVAIDQHFTQRGRQADMSSLVNRYPQLLGIGVDESTALVVQKSQGKVVGKGKVFFYDRGQRAAHETPDYIALGDGESFDLAKREVLQSSSLESANEEKKATDGK